MQMKKYNHLNPQILAFSWDLDVAHIIQHGRSTQDPNTRSQGNRIDYILISTSLVDSVTASGIMPLNHIIISDHKASFYDFDTISLFITPPVHNLYVDPPRLLKMFHPTTVQKYLQQLDLLWIYHKIYGKIEALLQKFYQAEPSEYPNLVKELNALDLVKNRYMTTVTKVWNSAPNKDIYETPPLRDQDNILHTRNVG